MKTSARFENAVQNLYYAFHSNILHPECCKQCAVGNILNNSDAWRHLSDEHGSTELNYVGRVHQLMGRRFNGYTPLELLQIEVEFLKGCGYSLPLRHHRSKPFLSQDKNILFKGLCAAVDCLCKLDNMANVMDCSVLFAYEFEKEPIQLSASSFEQIRA